MKRRIRITARPPQATAAATGMAAVLNEMGLPGIQVSAGFEFNAEFEVWPASAGPGLRTYATEWAEHVGILLSDRLFNPAVRRVRLIIELEAES